MSDTSVDNPLRVGLRRERGVEPCVLVIFGASGDLTRRKLAPALYNLQVDRLLPRSFAIVGVARSPMPDSEFRTALREGVAAHSRRPIDERLWGEIEQGLSYVPVGDELDGFVRLREHLERLDRERGTSGNRLFYLAVPPSAFRPIVSLLAKAGVSEPGAGGSWCRVVLEKPIGHDLASASDLNDAINAVFDEEDVFRIDHYLGKETVQNLLVFRFANSIFEPLWNHKYIDHVQITVAESIGIEGRGRYFEEAGTTRDMVQNHLFQLLCLIGMEPPVALRADAIRDEKVKVLQSLREVDPASSHEATVRGQYAAGVIGDEKVIGYREEEGVDRNSRTETYSALELYIDNWRWAGVPFFLRAGKRLPKRATEIVLQFSGVPHRFFERRAAANSLTLRIQPDEGINLKFDAKIPGPKPHLQPVSMDFRYGSSFGQAPPEAYERLLLDAMLGDSTLFIRRDEVEAAWSYIDRLYEGWGNNGPEALPEYVSGTWGPAEADVLLARSGRTWRRP